MTARVRLPPLVAAATFLAAAACAPLVRDHPCDVGGGAFELTTCHATQGIDPGTAGALCRTDDDCAAHFTCENRECAFFNTAPAPAADDLAGVEDEVATLDVLANDTDLDDDALTIVAVDQPRNGIATIVNDGGAVQYAPLPNTNGLDALTYTVDDGSGARVTTSVTLSVASVPDPPRLLTTTISASEDATEVVPLLIAEDDGEVVVVNPVLFVEPEHGVAIVGGGALSYTPEANYFGPDALAVTIQDSSGATVDAAIAIEVFNVNDPPVAALTGPSALVDDDADLVALGAFDASGSNDVDDPTLSFVWQIDGIVVVAPDAAVVDLAVPVGEHIVTVVANDALGVASAASVAVSVAPAILFVDDDSPAAVPNGLAWESALPTLAEAIALSTLIPSVNEIWVAAGTYVPSPSFDPTVSFSLVGGVALLGGFAGNETVAEQRDPAVNASVLSGDLFDDDQAGFANRGENSLHVVRAVLVPPSAVLDGFVIRGGHARSGPVGDDREGAALFIRDAAPTLKNLVLIDNSQNGGGVGGIISSRNSSERIEDSVVADNLADAQFGGAYATALGNSLLQNVMFLRNDSPGSLGSAAVNAGGSVLTVVGCVFLGNTANGALTSINSGTLNVAFSTIVDNSSGVRDAALVESSILAGNGGAAQGNQTNQIAVVRSSCVEGFTGGGTNNSGAALAFVDRDGADDVLNTADDDLTLLAGSCGLDAGDAAALPTDLATDVLGRPRVAGLGVDGGAFEAP